MIYILYSDDYEVSLGGNYCPESEILIETTEGLLSACERAGVPMTLFADLACFWRYRELGRNAFPDMAEEQMRSAIRRGHDVQVHLHPHWLETDIVDRADGGVDYRSNLSRFLLGSWGSESDGSLYAFAHELLCRAKTYLTDLLRPVDPQYQCVAHRAGGYGLQPGERTLLGAMEDAGILIDSTVVPGMRIFTDKVQIDFTGLPKRGNYWLSRESGLSQAAPWGVFQIPIAAVDGRLILLRSELRKWLSRWRRRDTPDRGYAIEQTSTRHGLAAAVAYKTARLRNGCVRLSLEGELERMTAITRRYVRKWARDDEDLYFSLICHSKSENATTYAALEQYHARLKRMYGSRIEAITFQEAARRLRQDPAAIVP